MSKEKNGLIILILSQIPFILGFWFLYQPHLYEPQLVRPYINMVYFILLLAAGYFLMRRYGRVVPWPTLKGERKEAVKTLVFGNLFNVLLYVFLRLSVAMLEETRLLPKVKTGVWKFFVKPWNEINIVVSVLGIFLVVVAMEVFYRGYVQPFLCRYTTETRAILLTSLISGIRSATVTPNSGITDFVLAVVWGLVGSRAGLGAAIFTHMVWDILFVYFPG